jgi:virginiamycin B lyase
MLHRSRCRDRGKATTGWTAFALLVTEGLVLAGAAPCARGVALPGTGDLAGRVTASAALGQLTVHAFNTEKSVGYMVYVVDGRYRFVDLFPGHYDVSVRGTSGQLNADLPAKTTSLTLKVGQHASVNFTLAGVEVPPTYVGGMSYPDTKIEPYDVIYPPGPGRDTLERVCFACHPVQFYPYNVARTYNTGRPPHDRDGWAITVERMGHGMSFNTPGKASYFDGSLLSEKDTTAVVDYLATHFGPDSIPRSVKQETEPELDKSALAKAEFVEYRLLNKAGQNRYTHTVDFDPTNGHVFAFDRGESIIVEINPETGARKDHVGVGGGEYLQVDVDGTVWYGGLRHYDPKTGAIDIYKRQDGKPFAVSSMVFDSKGDLWLSLLSSGGFAKWDRKTDTVSWWDVPILRSRPYGITIDHNEKIWFGEYHASAIASFDPATGKFRNYPVTPEAPTNIRRVGVDSGNFIWTGTWGRPHPKEGGSIYRVDPQTGESVGHNLGIDYSSPYDCDVDDVDHVWVATDNHVLMFDPSSNRFTRYPVPQRSDLPKLSITRDGAIWFSPRNAGFSGGYGGAPTVLYPDKDRIRTFAAYYSARSERNHQSRYRGPVAKVAGAVKLQANEPQNPGDYDAMLISIGLAPADKSQQGSTRVLKGGAAVE